MWELFQKWVVGVIKKKMDVMKLKHHLVVCMHFLNSREKVKYTKNIFSFYK